MLFLCDKLHDCRINIAGARAHHKALKRSEAHRRIHTLSILHRADRSAVPQVRDDNF